MPYIW